MKEQNTGEADAMADVLDGWNHNDAKQVLQAVHQAMNGNITRDDLINRLIDATGGDYKEHLDEDGDGKIIKDGKRLITFYLAMDENYDFEAASDPDVAIDNLSGHHRRVKCTTWMAPPKVPTAEIVIPDDAGDTVNVEA